MARAVIVLTVDDPHLSPTDVHEAVIVALDFAGFRDWTSYLAKPGDPLPEPRIPPPELPA